jgi:hypothetical protein
MNHSFKIPDRDYELARQLWGQSWASELRRIVTLELAAEARRKDTPPTSPQLEVVRELASVPPAFELRAITEETIQDAYEVRLSNGQFTRQIVVISLPSDSYGKV